MHRLQELLQGDGARAVLVEDPEGALHEERLRRVNNSASSLRFDSYIFRRNNLLELVECELRLALAHVVPEDGLQPLDVVPGECSVLDLAGDADYEGHELLHGVDRVLVLVNAGQQLWNNSLAVPDLSVVSVLGVTCGVTVTSMA